MLAGGGGGGGFTPVTRTYNSGTAATETVPTGATNVVITLWGGGGSGGNDKFSHTSGQGGGSGAYCQKSQVTSGGSTFTYTVGAGGAYVLSDHGNAGAATTVVTPEAVGG